MRYSTDNGAGTGARQVNEALTTTLVQMARVNPVLTSLRERQRVLPEALGLKCLACLALVSFLQGRSDENNDETAFC